MVKEMHQELERAKGVPHERGREAKSKSKANDDPLAAERRPVRPARSSLRRESRSHGEGAGSYIPCLADT